MIGIASDKAPIARATHLSQPTHHPPPHHLPPPAPPAALVGPESVPILEELRVARDLITERAEHTHVLLNFQGSPVQLAKGAGMRGAGFTMVADEAVVG